MMEVGKGGLLRTKTGCATCRIRHVKCDEAKPNCNKCEKTGRKCDGYHTASQNTPPRERNPRTSSVSRALPALPSFDDLRQRDCFAFFVSRISNATTVYFGANFWAHHVLQLSLSEPSIRYALCSLSALYRMSTISNPKNLEFPPADLRNYALQQYNHAVRCTRILLAETSDTSNDKLIKGLVACALFVSYETFTGNHRVSQMHLRNGYRIILKEGRKSSRSRIPRDIIQVFKRLDMQATSFSHSRIPQTDHLADEPLGLIPMPSPGAFSLEDSVDVVLDLCRWLFRNAGSTTCPVSPVDLQCATDALRQWNLEILRSLNTPFTKPNGLPQPTTLLHIYQIIMTIIIATGVTGRETRHDEHLEKYKQVLTLAESLNCSQFFCFDIGVIFPLFWVTTKCRDSRTRRRALAMLASMHHQEGVWTSSIAAKVAEFVVDIEEEGLTGEPLQHEIVEAKRVHLVHTVADEERGEICLSCLLRDSIDGNGWYTRDGRFSSEGELLPALRAGVASKRFELGGWV